MYNQYEGVNFPLINVATHYEGDAGIIAQTLGYNSYQELLVDQSKIYSINKHNPFLMKDMDIMVDRIFKHIQNKSSILIFGDFDVDGISAASVLLKGLRYLGVEDLNVLIPNREVGYSIKREYILEHINNPINTTPDLIITVDCGIKSGDDIDFIVNQLGIEVLVTDHHGVDEANLPKAATAIVNPHRIEGNYPFKEISGSLVALKVMEALDEYIYNTLKQPSFITGPRGNPNEVMEELQDLAMLGTVADVMPIRDENKWLVRETLRRLPRSANLGLMAFTNKLIKQYNEGGSGMLNTDFIGWHIGPRINASGRIGNPYDGLRMFIEEDPVVIDRLFDILDSVNKKRQDILKDDYLIAKEEENNNNNNAIVYINDQLLDGIIGLIAGRLKEYYYKPTIAIGGKAIVVDMVYNKRFTQEEEMGIYSFLFALSEFLVKQYGQEVFYGASIKDGNRIIFSIADALVNNIEEAFMNAFSDVENVLLEGAELYIQDNYNKLPLDEKKSIDYNSYRLELLRLNPKLSEDYLSQIATKLSTINKSDFSFEYKTVLKGSCRSIEGFNVTEALDILNEEYKRNYGKSLLLGFGGHPLAAGFGILEENVDIFKSLFEQFANKYVTEDMMKKELNVNLEIDDLGLVDVSLVNEIYSMGPYGNKNEYPKVMIRGRPIYGKISKSGKSVNVLIEDNRGNQIEILFFRYKEDKYIEAFCNNIVNLNREYTEREFGFVGTLQINERQGTKTVQLIPLDIVGL